VWRRDRWLPERGGEEGKEKREKWEIEGGPAAKRLADHSNRNMFH